MTVKTFKLPPGLDRQARKIASRDGVSVHQLVARAVSAMIQADQTFHCSSRMTKRTAKKRLLALLAKAPDVPPQEGDEIPTDLAAKLEKLRSTRRNGAR